MDDNIHAPTVASGPTTTGGPDRDPAKLSMVELMQEKERIEEELSALSSILTSVSNQMAPTLENISNHLNLSQHGVNMNSSLTTFDDFPRADIDVAQSKNASLMSKPSLSLTQSAQYARKLFDFATTTKRS